MPSFCAVFNFSNHADREKSNYLFPSVVKNNGNEGLKLEKWLAQIFGKDLTERKLKSATTRNKTMLSTYASSFFTQISS